MHDVTWWLRDKDLNPSPSELDDASVEYIEKMIREGYREGELIVAGDEQAIQYHGWWKIAA